MPFDQDKPWLGDTDTMAWPVAVLPIINKVLLSRACTAGSSQFVLPKSTLSDFLKLLPLSSEQQTWQMPFRLTGITILPVSSCIMRSWAGSQYIPSTQVILKVLLNVLPPSQLVEMQQPLVFATVIRKPSSSVPSLSNSREGIELLFLWVSSCASRMQSRLASDSLEKVSPLSRLSCQCSQLQLQSPLVQRVVTLQILPSKMMFEASLIRVKVSPPMCTPPAAATLATEFSDIKGSSPQVTFLTPLQDLLLQVTTAGPGMSQKPAAGILNYPRPSALALISSGERLTSLYPSTTAISQIIYVLTYKLNYVQLRQMLLSAASGAKDHYLNFEIVRQHIQFAMNETAL